MTRNVALLAGSLAMLLSACGSVAVQEAEGNSKMLSDMAAKKNFYLRNVADDDPSSYIGRFIPDSVAEGDVDESKAEQNACSEYIKAKKVRAGGTKDDEISVSHELMAGLKKTAKVTAGLNASGQALLKIHYALTDKWIAEVTDFEAFSECCKEYNCPSRYISEYYGGTHKLYSTSGEEVSGGFGFSAGGASSEGKASRTTNESLDTPMFFAFSVGTPPKGPVASASAGSDDADTAAADANAEWCDNPPQTRTKTCFCGVSALLDDEADAREDAETNARAKLSQYIGTEISKITGMARSTKATSAKDSKTARQIDSATEEKTSAFVSSLLTEKAKVEKVRQPSQMMYRGKALMCITKKQLDALKPDTNLTK